MKTRLQLSKNRAEFIIAIVGMGPRGIAVLEHLAVNLRGIPSDSQVRILVIDDVEVGAGRIWRTNQPGWLMMNTLTSQITMYSGGPDEGPARPGAGPNLYEWLCEQSDPSLPRLGPGECAPRVVYGHYLRAVYQSIVSDLPDNVILEEVRSRVTSIEREGDAYRLIFANDRVMSDIQKIVLTTGHPKNNVGPAEQRYQAFAARQPGLTYIPGGSAADMPLEQLRETDTVGIMGMGLGFYDVLLSLTVGRGGYFETEGDGLRYCPSGREPKVVAGSRGGAPIFARGVNHKKVGQKSPPRFLTVQAIQDARLRSRRLEGTDMLDFNRDVLTLLQSELEHVYYKIHVRLRDGVARAEQFAVAHVAAVYGGDASASKVLEEYDLQGVPRLDLFALARPFAGQDFSDPAAFQRALEDLLQWDLKEARLGNVDGPLKAALDVLRDVRDNVRVAVDFGGLRPKSFQNDFLGAFVPVCSILSAGPPAIRIEQALALMRANVLEVLGPDACFACDEQTGRYRLHSPRVAGGVPFATVLVDSRIPMTDLKLDSSELTQALLADGEIAPYVVQDALNNSFNTGGMAVTDSPFQIVDARGEVNPDIFALGIPTEHTRWFTQVGSDTPNAVTRFSKDAEAIASQVLQSVMATFERVEHTSDQAGLPGPANTLSMVAQ